jgi:hypothetical protein
MVRGHHSLQGSWQDAPSVQRGAAKVVASALLKRFYIPRKALTRATKATRDKYSSDLSFE